MSEAQFWIGVHGVICRDGRILVLKRSDSMSYRPQHWDLPGGHLMVSESFQECLRREVAEETGLEIEVKRLIALLKRPCEPFVQVLYACKPVTPYTEIQLRPEEHAEARWVTLEELASLRPLVPYLENALCDGLLVPGEW